MGNSLALVSILSLARTMFMNICLKAHHLYLFSMGPYVNHHIFPPTPSIGFIRSAGVPVKREIHLAFHEQKPEESRIKALKNK